jgi:hypothetical protein
MEALANDMAFRAALAMLREAWQEVIGEAARLSDGFFLIVRRVRRVVDSFRRKEGVRSNRPLGQRLT